MRAVLYAKAPDHHNLSSLSIFLSSSGCVLSTTFALITVVHATSSCIRLNSALLIYSTLLQIKLRHPCSSILPVRGGSLHLLQNPCQKKKTGGAQTHRQHRRRSSRQHISICPAAAWRIIRASRDVTCPSPLTSAATSNGRLPDAISSAITASAAVTTPSQLRSPHSQ